MTGVGEQLQRARQRAGLSIPELSARTKIPARHLDAIERDDFSRLPAGVFTRGFLSAYAREVHLDPDAILAEYAAAQAPLPEPAPVPVEPPKPPVADSPRFGAWLQGLTAAAILASLYLLTVIPGDAPVEDATPTATTGSDESSGAVEPVAASLVSSQEAPSPGDTFRVEIRPAAVVWVEATADGERALYRLVEADEAVTIDVRNEVNIRVGDAAAFRYSIDGKPGRSLGGPGEVREVRLTRDGYQELLEHPQGSSQR